MQQSQDLSVLLPYISADCHTMLGACDLQLLHNVTTVNITVNIHRCDPRLTFTPHSVVFFSTTDPPSHFLIHDEQLDAIKSYHISFENAQYAQVWPTAASIFVFFSTKLASHFSIHNELDALTERNWWGLEVVDWKVPVDSSAWECQFTQCLLLHSNTCEYQAGGIQLPSCMNTEY